MWNIMFNCMFILKLTYESLKSLNCYLIILLTSLLLISFPLLKLKKHYFLFLILCKLRMFPKPLTSPQMSLCLYCAFPILFHYMSYEIFHFLLQSFPMYSPFAFSIFYYFSTFYNVITHIKSSLSG